MEKEPLHILLAEDDEGDRLLFTEAFSSLEIRTVVRTVNDGLELMTKLNDTGHPPHLVFLDLNMPLRNGLECLKEIRNDEKLKNVFIAIYSTSDNEKDIEEAFSNGANVYISKPSHFDTLKKVLEKAVSTAYQYQDQSLKRELFLLRI